MKLSHIFLILFSIVVVHEIIAYLPTNIQRIIYSCIPLIIVLSLLIGLLGLKKRIK